MSFFRSPNPFFNLPCTVCCITKGVTDSLSNEVKHPLVQQEGKIHLHHYIANFVNKKSVNPIGQHSKIDLTYINN